MNDDGKRQSREGSTGSPHAWNQIATKQRKPHLLYRAGSTFRKSTLAIGRWPYIRVMPLTLLSAIRIFSLEGVRITFHPKRRRGIKEGYQKGQTQRDAGAIERDGDRNGINTD